MIVDGVLIFKAMEIIQAIIETFKRS